MNTKKVVAGLALKKIKDWKIDKGEITSEAKLQPSQTFMAEHFCKNSQWLKVVDYFRRKAPSQMFVSAFNTPQYLL